VSTSFCVSDILTTSAPSFVTISIAIVMAFRSLTFIFPPNLRPRSSVSTSSGTIHVTSSEVIPFMTASKSIFCFVQVMIKFVSSRIFIIKEGWEDLYKLAYYSAHEREG